MKKLLVYFLLISIYGCSGQNDGYFREFRFSNFDTTVAKDLALSIKNDDVASIKAIINKNKDYLTILDPNYKMSLLALSIVNNKKNAFKALLDCGADVNKRFGIVNQYNALYLAVNYSNSYKDCDDFYIRELIKKGAHARPMEYVTSEGQNVIFSPLFLSLSERNSKGDNCNEIPKLLLEHGATLDDRQSGFAGDEKISVIEECLISKNLDFLEYLLIEKKMKAPKIAITYTDMDTKISRTKTITEVLESSSYTDLIDDGIKLQAKELIKYLKATGQK